MYLNVLVIFVVNEENYMIEYKAGTSTMTDEKTDKSFQLMKMINAVIRGENTHVINRAILILMAGFVAHQVNRDDCEKFIEIFCDELLNLTKQHYELCKYCNKEIENDF